MSFLHCRPAFHTKKPLPGKLAVRHSHFVAGAPLPLLSQCVFLGVGFPGNKLLLLF